MGSRDAQREASRARVLEAAHELFAEFGYADTTVRMIADRAGLSVGGVFTTFEDKADILHHVRMSQSAALRETMARVAPTLEGSTCDRVSRLLAMAYEQEWPHLPQVIAYIGASYGWSGTTEAAMQTDHSAIFTALEDLLKDGIARDELHPDFDVKVAGELIYGVYLGQYRRAWYGSWSAAQAAAHVEKKLCLIFSGLAYRSKLDGKG